MPSFNEHITQAKRNLDFLYLTNSKNNNFWDWQVTICFYTSLHLVNAHIANIANLHYRKHEEVNVAINPYSAVSPCKLPENVYLSYMKLQGLSRRARYLIHEDYTNKSSSNHFTYDKHLSKAIRHLDVLLNYMTISYKVVFSTQLINCLEFKDTDTKYFKKV